MKYRSAAWSRMSFLAVVLLSVTAVVCEDEEKPKQVWPPGAIAGPSSGYVDSVYQCSTFSSTNYWVRFSWGDGDTSEKIYSPWIGSHAWSDTGTYEIKAQAGSYRTNTIPSDWACAHPIVIVSNTAPRTPSAPDGPSAGDTGATYSFASSASDPLGDSVALRFDWGDGDTSGWSALIPSGGTATDSHAWSDTGSYLIRARARNKKGELSAWSQSHQLDITTQGNQPPNVPSPPAGPDSGVAGLQYTFWTRAIDPDTDYVAVRFSWGDGDTSAWSTQVRSGDTVRASHAWSAPDTCYVYAQARDERGATSNWSPGYAIKIGPAPGLWRLATSTAGWSPRSMHAAVVYSGKMWVMGGSDWQGVTNDVWYTSDGTNWTCATSSADWAPRAKHKVVVHGGKMWVLGGERNAGQVFSEAWYSTDGVAWTLATDSVVWLTDCADVVELNGKAWAVDRWPSGEIRNSTDCINWEVVPDSGRWRSRSTSGVAVHNSRIWVMGGFTHPGRANDVWYTTDGIRATKVIDSAQWSGRHLHEAVSYDGELWVLGGYTTEALNDVWHSGDGASWTCQTDSADWEPRSNFATLVFNNSIWVLGGSTRSGSADDVWYWP